MRRLAVPLFAITTLAIAAWAPGANAVTSVSSSAYGLGAGLDVLGVVGVGVGPIDPVSGAAPTAYTKSATVLSVTDTLSLADVLGIGLAKQALDTGIIVTSASSPFLPTPTGTATATVDGLGTSLNSLLGSTFLSLSATTVTSTSSVDGTGSLSALGSTQIEGLKVSGSALKGATIDGSLFVNPAPNTIIFNLGGLEILLNEQIPSGDGVTSEAIQTNAIDILFNNFALSTGILNGSVIIAHSQAAIFGPAVAAVPEPSTWAELLAGFAIVGSVLRRRAARFV